MLYISQRRFLCVLLYGAAACFGGTIAADPKALYAVDIAPPLDAFDARCLNISGYSTVFLRVYSPFTYEGPEKSVCESIENARKAGLGVEVCVVPFPPNMWDGWQQVDKLYNGLSECKIFVQRIWLVVGYPSSWYFDIEQNNRFIKQVFDKGREYNIDIGIYTKDTEWMQITGGYANFTSSPLLWYWNINNTGPRGETTTSFVGFHPFGIWKAATVKQFGQRVPVCGRYVNRDIYFATLQSTSSNASSIGEYICISRSDREVEYGWPRKLRTPRKLRPSEVCGILEIITCYFILF
ncbi:hypothetical protein Aduo_007141 [Ancylostoma duodenale]